MNNLAYLRPIKGPLPKEVLDKLIADARDDNHEVFKATHLIMKDSEVVGYFSMGAIPVVFGWLSTKKIKPYDTKTLFNTAEGILSQADAVMVPIPSFSPVHAVMVSHLGYRKQLDATIFIKDLN